MGVRERERERESEGEVSYRHDAVELGGLDHLAEAERLLFNGGFAGLARRSRRLRVLHLPWLLGLRVLHSSLSPFLSLQLRSERPSLGFWGRKNNFRSPHGLLVACCLVLTDPGSVPFSPDPARIITVSLLSPDMEHITTCKRSFLAAFQKKEAFLRFLLNDNVLKCAKEAFCNQVNVKRSLQRFWRKSCAWYGLPTWTVRSTDVNGSVDRSHLLDRQLTRGRHLEGTKIHICHITPCSVILFVNDRVGYSANTNNPKPTTLWQYV